MALAKETIAPAVEEAKRRVLAEATRKNIKEIVARLQECLGQELTAIIAGVTDVKAVGRWISGKQSPRPDSETALRDAYKIVELLLAHERPETVRAWMRGMNFMLENRAPALVIREQPQAVAEAADALIAFA